jgi:AcrR family transcriptional regulator
MASSPGPAPLGGITRHDQILDAMGAVFLRYGFAKTSMVELARAAGLSRQGLYLHFETKEAAFTAACLRLVGEARTRHEAALKRGDLETGEHLLVCFEALHGVFVDNAVSEHLDELLASADPLVRRRLAEIERRFIGDIADFLVRSETPSGPSARDLAEHLHAVSLGLKHLSRTRVNYRARMRLAIKLVTGGSR